MSSSSAISGLNAAANSISVVSNNIANANTTGFKQSVAQFADVYTNNFQGANANTGGTTQPGSGVKVIQDTQQFSQGAAQTTGNNLDMVINGNGFFTLAPNPGQPTAVVYSRAGSFNVNKAGMVTNTEGQALMVYKPNNAASASAGFSTGAMSTISVPAGSGLPSATNAISLAVNLNAGSTSPAVTPFNPLDSNTYTSQTSTTIYDSLGGAHNLTTYYVALGADPNTANQTDWAAYNYMTDNPKAPQLLTAKNGTAGVTSGGIPQNNPSLYSASLVNNTASAYTALSNAVQGGISISPDDIAVNYTKISSDTATAQNSPATYLKELNATAVTQANVAVDATAAAKANAVLNAGSFKTLLTGAANLKAFSTAQNAAAIAFPGAQAAVDMLSPLPTTNEVTGVSQAGLEASGDFTINGVAIAGISAPMSALLTTPDAVTQGNSVATAITAGLAAASPPNTDISVTVDQTTGALKLTSKSGVPIIIDNNPSATGPVAGTGLTAGTTAIPNSVTGSPQLKTLSAITALTINGAAISMALPISPATQGASVLTAITAGLAAATPPNTDITATADSVTGAITLTSKSGVPIIIGGNAADMAATGLSAGTTALTQDLTKTKLALLAQAVLDKAKIAADSAAINADNVLAVQVAAGRELSGQGTTAERLAATNAAVGSASTAASDALNAQTAIADYNAGLQKVSSYLPGGMATTLTMGYSASNAAASAVQANNAKTFAVAAAATATKVLASTTTPSTLVAAAALANSTAQAAAASATAYAAAASLVSNVATATLASTAAETAQTDADSAAKAAAAYNTALLVAAPGFVYNAGSLLSFNAVGQLNSPPISTLMWSPPIGAPISTSMDYSNTTQISSAFNVIASTQNGLVAGTLTGITVNSSGVISANYSNSSSIALGQVALANFNNPQGLSQIGGSNWGQSAASGTAISGSPGNGEFGTIQSGAIEQSNVNLSEQLVALITAQQAYQANSQSISAQNKMVETILNAAR